MTKVLVVGATGSIGRLVVAEAHRAGLEVRALVRDRHRGAQILPDTELAEGDLRSGEGLTTAVDGIGAVIFTHGTNGGGDAEDVDYGGVANVLAAVGTRPVRIVLMTSISSSHEHDERSGTGQLLTWKRRSERLVRATGNNYTIVRPSWFDHVDAHEQALVLSQGDTTGGGIGRSQLAQVLVNCLIAPEAINTTFELAAEAGSAPADWSALFARLTPDDPDSLDASQDRPQLPLGNEPPRLIQDIEKARERRPERVQS